MIDLARMTQALRDFYGPQPAPPANLFQFFVWEILSENALPARRDHAWLALKRIPALTPDAMFGASATALLAAVSLAGPNAEERIDRVRETLTAFRRNPESLAAESLRASGLLRAARTLRRLYHVDSGTRDRAYLFSAGFPVLPLDQDVVRVISRLSGRAPAMSTMQIRTRPREMNRLRRDARKWLAHRLEPSLPTARDVLIYFRYHAQQTCIAVGPHCAVCPLRTACASVQGRDASS